MSGPTPSAQDRIIDALVADPDFGRADVVRHDNGEAEVRLYDHEGVHVRTAKLTPIGPDDGTAVEIEWEEL